MSTDEPQGADLARSALLAARKAAAERGERGRAQRKPARRLSARGDGREPMRLGGAVERLVTERGWEEPVTGGAIKERWEAIVGPQIVQRLRAEAFHDDTRQLDLLPESRAWLVQGQLIATDLLRQINAALGEGAVRKIHVLSPDHRPRKRPEPASTAHLDSASASPEPLAANHVPDEYRKARATMRGHVREEVPAKARTREDAGAGFHHALAAIRPTAPQEPQGSNEPPRTDKCKHPGYREARDNIGAATPPPAPAPARRPPHTQYRMILQKLHESRVLSIPAP
ncbi:DciA family protein [Streptomyces sp. NPDC015125]|uniref:DciA family protein n=1 Tax=Streptomyces sp. NPDC015125 TaxID=3364938 RepID=UPI0036F9E506